MLLNLGPQSIDIELGGVVRFDRQWTNTPHRHPGFQELCWVIEGHGEFSHGGSIIPLETGSCFISEPNILHEISSAHSKDLALQFITFSPSALNGPHDPEAKRIWKSYAHAHCLHGSLAQPAAYWDLIYSADIHRQHFLIRALFLESLSMLATADAPTPLDNQADLGSQAMAYIRSHCREAPSVSDVAQSVDLSERQLRRIFHQRYQSGIVEAINISRLQVSRQLLLMHKSVSATAEAIGIASPAMFCRLFKQAYGCSPNQWRKRHLQTEMPATTVFGET